MKLISENIKYRSRRLVDLKDYKTSLFNKQDDPKASLSNNSSNRIPCLADKEQFEHGE